MSSGPYKGMSNAVVIVLARRHQGMLTDSGKADQRFHKTCPNVGRKIEHAGVKLLWASLLRFGTFA